MRSAVHVLHRLGAVSKPMAPEELVDLEPVATVEREGFFAGFMGRAHSEGPRP
jgi:hypothetical protein